MYWDEQTDDCPSFDFVRCQKWRVCCEVARSLSLKPEVYVSLMARRARQTENCQIEDQSSEWMYCQPIETTFWIVKIYFFTRFWQKTSENPICATRGEWPTVSSTTVVGDWTVRLVPCLAFFLSAAAIGCEQTVASLNLHMSVNFFNFVVMAMPQMCRSMPGPCTSIVVNISDHLAIRWDDRKNRVFFDQFRQSFVCVRCIVLPTFRHSFTRANSQVHVALELMWASIRQIVINNKTPTAWGMAGVGGSFQMYITIP